MKRGLATSVLFASAFATRGAIGATCYAQRPTEPLAAWSYDGAPVGVFDTAEGNVRVWYATEGQHAPTGVVQGSAPTGAVAAGAAAESALARFGELGFRAPLTGGPSSCSDSGGDGRLDLYLFDFHAADGTIMIEQCAEADVETCSGFALVENDFAGSSYASPEEGFRTVVPHELFHLVQHAYSSNGEAWWAEGTAQWAAKQVFPELSDLERLLPAFFSNTDRPLDFPPVGAAAGFSYGAAIWPVFLAEHVGSGAVREIFERLGERDEDVLDATDAALQRRGTSLDAAFTDFALWNAATGTRAASDGYADAATYPEAQFAALAEGVPGSAQGVLAGLSARYFLVPGGPLRDLMASGDSARLSARFLPLGSAAPRLDRARDLPLETAESGVIVVSGRARDHRDVSFTIRIAEAASVGGTAGAAGSGGVAAGDGGGAGLDDGAATSDGGEANRSDGDAAGAAGESPSTQQVSPLPRDGAVVGCSCGTAVPARPPGWFVLASLAAGGALGRALARRSGRSQTATQSRGVRFSRKEGVIHGYRY